jgi:hypothetical protein
MVMDKTWSEKIGQITFSIVVVEYTEIKVECHNLGHWSQLSAFRLRPRQGLEVHANLSGTPIQQWIGLNEVTEQEWQLYQALQSILLDPVTLGKKCSKLKCDLLLTQTSHQGDLAQHLSDSLSKFGFKPKANTHPTAITFIPYG